MFFAQSRTPFFWEKNSLTTNWTTRKIPYKTDGNIKHVSFLNVLLPWWYMHGWNFSGLPAAQLHACMNEWLVCIVSTWAWRTGASTTSSCGCPRRRRRTARSCHHAPWWPAGSCTRRRTAASRRWRRFGAASWVPSCWSRRCARQTVLPAGSSGRSRSPQASS